MTWKQVKNLIEYEAIVIDARDGKKKTLTFYKLREKGIGYKNKVLEIKYKHKHLWFKNKIDFMYPIFRVLKLEKL